MDDMPRLSCPDLAAAVARWQQVWEGRDEAGACLDTALPCCCPEHTPIMQQYSLIAIKQEGTRGLHLESACMAGQEPCNERCIPARRLMKSLGGSAWHACAAQGSWEAVQLDRELLKAEVRPDVREDIRLQADEETHLLLANLKACLLSSLLLHIYISMHVSISGM